MRVPTTFFEGPKAGYFREEVGIPFIASSAPAWVQVRAWEAVGGRSFEQAALHGKWTAVANLLHLITGGPSAGVPIQPAFLAGLAYPGTPLVIRDPLDQKSRASGTAKLSVVASTGILASYQWYEGSSGDTNSPVLGATNAVFTTPALTTNTMFWVNIYDSAGSTNSAAAKVTVFPANAVLLSLAMTSGLPALVIDAPTNTPLRVQYTSNPGSTNWRSLVDLTLDSTPFDFVDSSATNAAARFYRVIAPYF